MSCHGCGDSTRDRAECRSAARGRRATANSGTQRSRFPGQPAIRAGIGEHTGWCGDRTSGDPSLGAGSTVPIVTAEPFAGWARSPRCSTRRPRFARAFICPRLLQKVLALIPRRRSTVRPGRGRGGGRCSTPDRAFGRRIWHGAWSRLSDRRTCQPQPRDPGRPGLRLSRGQSFGCHLNNAKVEHPKNIANSSIVNWFILYSACLRRPSARRNPIGIHLSAIRTDERPPQNGPETQADDGKTDSKAGGRESGHPAASGFGFCSSLALLS